MGTDKKRKECLFCDAFLQSDKFEKGFQTFQTEPCSSSSLVSSTSPQTNKKEPSIALALFCSAVLSLDKELGSHVNEFTVCQNCNYRIKSVLGTFTRIEEVEERVRQLQYAILGEMKELKILSDLAFFQLTKINDSVVKTVLNKTMTLSPAVQDKKTEKVNIIRNAVPKVVQEMQKFQNEIGLKISIRQKDTLGEPVKLPVEEKVNDAKIKQPVQFVYVSKKMNHKEGKEYKEEECDDSNADGSPCLMEWEGKKKPIVVNNMSNAGLSKQQTESTIVEKSGSFSQSQFMPGKKRPGPKSRTCKPASTPTSNDFAKHTTRCSRNTPEESHNNKAEDYSQGFGFSKPIAKRSIYYESGNDDDDKEEDPDFIKIRVTKKKRKRSEKASKTCPICLTEFTNIKVLNVHKLECHFTSNNMQENDKL